MAKWTKNKVTPEQINNGNEYTVNDNVSVEALNGIVNNSLKAQEDAERALELAEGANEANGTVVKINGEPQGTWDATFAQELYEESANEFNEITAIGNADNNTGAFTYTSTGNNLLSVDYMPMKPNTIYSYKTSKSGLWIYEYDNNRNFLGIVDIVSGRSFTSKPNTAYFRVAFWGGYGTTYLNDAIVKEGTNPVYYPYNPNRHITNPQAEFLKEEFEKQKNIFNKDDILKVSGYSYINNVTNKIETDTYETTYYVPCEPNTKYTISKKNVSYRFRLGCTSAVPAVGVSVSNAQDTTDEAIKSIITAGDSKYLVFSGYSGSDKEEITLSQFLEGFMIEEGDLSSYQPYNSSSHITNEQADLLKSEWEKSANLYNPNKATRSGQDVRLQIFKPLKNKYSFNIGSYTWASASLYDASGSLIKIEGNEQNSKVITFEPTSNTDHIVFSFYSGVSNLSEVDFTQIMLNEGNPLPYQEYNGEIIHREDIKPVLLWENGNPNVAMGVEIGTLSKSLVVGKNYALYYKYSTSATSKIKLEFKYGGVGYLGWLNMFDSDENNSYLRSRLIEITSDTTIKFYDAMSNVYVANGNLIPTELYELPY